MCSAFIILYFQRNAQAHSSLQRNNLCMYSVYCFRMICKRSNAFQIQNAIPYIRLLARTSFFQPSRTISFAFSIRMHFSLSLVLVFVFQSNVLFPLCFLLFDDCKCKLYHIQYTTLPLVRATRSIRSKQHIYGAHCTECTNYFNLNANSFCLDCSVP